MPSPRESAILPNTYPLIISLGGNLGERENYLHKARQQLLALLGPFTQVSSIYETEAWGIQKQPAFLNQVLVAHTQKAPIEALHILQTIENDLGRIRKEKWAARTIDLDILYYDDQLIDLENLKVPHPYIPQRRFILTPLVEICPNWLHPELKLTQKELLAACEDPGLVYKWNMA